MKVICFLVGILTGWALVVGVLCWWSPPFGSDASKHRLAAVEQEPTKISQTLANRYQPRPVRAINPPAPYVPEPGTWE